MTSTIVPATLLAPSPTPTDIDMLTPSQSCARLNTSLSGLLDLVNSAALPAYRFGETIRFRHRDVVALALR